MTEPTPHPDEPDYSAALLAVDGPFELVPPPDARTRGRVFRHAPSSLGQIYRGLDRYEERTFCVYEGATLTYGALLRQAAALSAFLIAQRLAGRGMRIAIAMQNRPEWMIAFIAITAAGATAVLVNSRGTGPELRTALEQTDAGAVIADGPRAEALQQNGYGLPMVAIEPAATTRSTTSFAQAISGWEHAALDPVDMDAHDEALIMFTSGTTGGSKGVLLDQRGVTTGLMNIQYSMAVIGARIAAQQRPLATPASAAQPSALLAVPLFHSSGCYSIFLSNLLRGGKIVVMSKWHAMHALDLIEREKITAFSGSPTMLWDLLRQDRDGRDLRSLLSVGVGGQALQPQLLREIVAAFPNAILGGGYGMTEANGSVCLIAGQDLLQRPTSSGRIIPSADLRIVDEQDRDVPAGTVGEICLRGAMIMRGYCKRTADTAAVLRDGWLHTGDLGRLDTEHYLYVVDRKKDIVISGGENISCTEVENIALDYPGLVEVAAFGIDDERLGELLVLAVVTADGSRADARALTDHIGAHLAIYKVPRAIMECDTLPRNALGKIDRNALRQRFRAHR